MDGQIIAADRARDNPTFADWQAHAAALGLKRQGRELVGPCPDCGGTDRFAVKAVNGGGAVIHCRGCGGFREILRAAGMADDCPRTNGAREPEIIYVYRNLDGTPYHRVYRRGSGPTKAIRQSPGYKDQFLPYRIEEAPDWGELPVVVVEGERCADHLACRGYNVVSWCGGTGAVSRTDWDALAGQEAVLWADNDTKGAEAMQKVADALAALDCPVRHVRIPEGKPSGWDCVNATEAEVHRLIAESGENVFAPPIDGGEGRIDLGMRGMPMADLLTLPPDTQNWTVEGTLPTGGFSMLAGKPKTGKSTAARSLGFAVARGESFLGKRTAQGPVYYATFEERPTSVRDHFAEMGATAADPVHCFIGRRPADAMEALEVEMRRLKPVLVILDPIFRFLTIADENSYAELTRAMDPLLGLARNHGAHILAVHHARKQRSDDFTDEVLGSTAIFGRSTRCCC